MFKNPLRTLASAFLAFGLTIGSVNARLVFPGEDESSSQSKCQNLWEAAQQGRLDVLKQLIAQGADVNAKDENNMTPLMWAAEQGNIAIAKALIAAGADVFATDREGRTALLFAVNKVDYDGRMGDEPTLTEQPEAVQALLSAGADLNARDGKGNPPSSSPAATDLRRPCRCCSRPASIRTPKTTKAETPSIGPETMPSEKSFARRAPGNVSRPSLPTFLNALNGLTLR